MGKGGAIPMVGGRGGNSYFDNSAFPESRIVTVKDMVNQVIHDKLDIPIHMGTIRIADLGCSVGPNTFYSIQAVIDAVLMKLNRLPGDHGETPEFQVFFNDQIGNDFNLLFSSIPSDPRYLVAGVPGSFYSRLFPRASIHYVNSSLSLQWLSKAPDGVANKGRVHIYGGGQDVLNAYSSQFRSDMEQFLGARAEELVPGGLMALQFLCRPQWVAPDAARHDLWFAFLEPLLQEFVCEGKVKEEELGSFQVPIYAPTLAEFKEAVELNGCFTIHVAQLVNKGWGLKGGGDEGSDIDLQLLASGMGEAARAVFEIMVNNHFGGQIVEELFQRLPSKIYHHFTSLPHMPAPPPTAFFVLQRKPHSG
ncbi:farnesoic acid carboxyl-O-methyltransferase-like [Nymphaea colorata]|nr:farnesoic acid carboxyl-O-methyltransferase-like [Nymphaea colorata]